MLTNQCPIKFHLLEKVISRLFRLKFVENRLYIVPMQNHIIADCFFDGFENGAG